MLLVRSLLRIPKRNISALYVTNDKKSEHCSILVPFMDFENKLKNRQHLEENLKRRRLTQAHNLDELYQYYDLYTTITQRLAGIQCRRDEITAALSELKREGEEPSAKTTDLLRKYQEESTMLRNDFKDLKHESHSIDDKFVHQYLALPNDIHSRTPDEATVIATHGEIPTSKPETDVQGFVDYFDETAFYLENDTAKFDVFYPLNAVDQLRERGFIQFSNPDFAKSIIVEAAALQSNEVYGVKEVDPEDDVHLLHLVGSGSMLSFLGYIGMLVVDPNLLPLKFVCTGKQYVPKEQNDLGLYGVSQSTAVQVFCAGKENQIEQQFDDVLSAIDTLLAPLGLHYRVVYLPAHELKPAECLRARVEMFSKLYNQYIEVGNVSCYSDFISKRLLFNYKENSSTQFPHVISGTVCNVTRLVGLLLETHGQNFRLPAYLEEYNKP